MFSPTRSPRDPFVLVKRSWLVLAVLLALTMLVVMVKNGCFLSKPIAVSTSSNRAFTSHITLFRGNETLPFEAAASPWRDLRNLIIVNGHSALKFPIDRDRSFSDDEAWFVESYQRGQSGAFFEHIKRGVMLAAKDPLSLLLFSGGETKMRAGPYSEAQSYWLVAEHMNWFGFTNARNRRCGCCVSHHRAFSICRFRELVGRYPDRIVAVGFTFKRNRFLDLHRKAVRFPLERFEYEGADGPQFGKSGRKLVDVAQDEMKNGYLPYQNDLYGCGPFLSAKRKRRNPFRVAHGYAQSCPEIRDLLHYCGPDVFPGPLPWSPQPL